MTLPHEGEVVATKQKHVRLDGGLLLSNVLFMRKLQCNLIYVSHLIHDTQCLIQFTNSCYAMQDRHLGILIGVV